MTFPFNIYLAAFAGAFLASALTLPLWRQWCRRTGHVDDPGHRKIHHAPVPLAGGLAVLTGMIIPLILAAAWLAMTGHLSPAGWAESSAAGSTGGLERLVGGNAAGLLGYGFGRRALQLLALVTGALGMAALGWLDDRYELKPLPKFAGQALIAGLVAASGVRITLFVDNLVFSYLVTILWVLTVINALNFMDNMNGLCAGLGAIGSLCFALTAAAHGQYLVASVCFLICGALIGFLPHNFPQASAFLGDAGSHLIGYLLAVLAVLPHFYSKDNPRPAAVLGPLFILAVPLGDLLCVVVLRWRMGKPFYVGDTNHLSHRLVRRGWTKTGAVLLIWLIALAVGGISFLWA